MKKTVLKAFSVVLIFALCFSVVSCGKKETDDTIYVGNTAATTGAGASIGVPFNLGLSAALEVYNNAGGFNGRKVKLKTYDDGGDAAQSYTLMEKLVKEDNIFAVVGNYGSYAVASNLQFLKDNSVPMVYAAAGNKILLNENATSEGDRGIFPVQPLNYTEGQMLILRAFAPTDKGGLAATKVGVISNSDESSQGIVEGIKAEAAASGLTNINYQNVTTDNYSGAASALLSDGCNVIIITVNGTPFVSALSALADVNYNGSVLTTYNNSSAAIFNDSNSKMTETAVNIFSKMAIFAQAWLDITDTTNYYKDESSALYKTYRILELVQKDESGNELGVPGFTDEYWTVANNIYNYAVSINNSEAFNMSYNAYALAGYIAGDLFCQALSEMQKAGMELTRSNLVSILESKDFEICMSDSISYKNGYRSGVQSFALTMFYDTAALPEGATSYHCASSATVYPLTSIEEYRALISK